MPELDAAFAAQHRIGGLLEDSGMGRAQAEVLAAAAVRVAVMGDGPATVEGLFRRASRVLVLAGHGLDEDS